MSRLILKQLAVAQDIVHGVGKVIQPRGDKYLSLDKVDIPLGLLTEAEVADVNAAIYPRVRVGSTEFQAVNGTFQRALDLKPFVYTPGYVLTASNPYVYYEQGVYKRLVGLPYTLTNPVADKLNKVDLAFWEVVIQAGVGVTIESVDVIPSVFGDYEGQSFILSAYNAGWNALVTSPKGGGILTYTATPQEVDNGTVFACGNGWLVRADSPYLTPEMFGAVRDGITNDQPAFAKAVLSDKCSELRLAAGDYHVADTIPLKTGLVIRGAGMPGYDADWLDIVQTLNVGGKQAFKVLDPKGIITFKIMQGDPLKSVGVSNMSGVLGVQTVIPGSATLVTDVNYSASVSFSPGAQLRVTHLAGGTVIRHTKLNNTFVSNKQFFDCKDVRAFGLYDIGFVGPGINAGYGGGMRFRRTAGPDGVSRAITGYHWDNIFIAHVAMDAIRFDQLIHSYLGHLNVNRCVGDALLFKAGPTGGSTTSVHIDTPYIQNARRGIAMHIAVYCTISNPVVEGCSLAYYINRGIACVLDAPASETIKYDKVGQGGGDTVLCVDCYGMVINAPTVYYNTESDEWAKASMVFIDPNRLVESPCASISGGHFHYSLNPKVPVVGTRWSASTGRLYLDVSRDADFVPATPVTQSRWETLWQAGRQVCLTGITADEAFNHRHKITRVAKYVHITTGAIKLPRPPTVTDDSSLGYEAFVTHWQDTENDTRLGRYFCLDATVGAAVWIPSEHVWEVDFNGRQSKALPKEIQSSAAFAYRLGRNYGVDVATDNIQRVAFSSTDATGSLFLGLDIYHLHPVRYEVLVDYNPYVVGETVGEYIVKSIKADNIGGEPVVRVECIVGQAFGHVNDNVIKPLTGATCRFAQYVPTAVNVSYVKEDLATGNLFVYFKASDYFKAGETVHVQNCLISTMDGNHTVNSVELATVDGILCVRAKTNTVLGRKNIAQTPDFGVYVKPEWSGPVSTQISYDAVAGLYAYDEANAIATQVGKRGTVTVSGSSVTVSVRGANNYHFDAKFNASPVAVYVSAQTLNTVTFSFAASVSGQVLAWSAYRKKNPGFEAIADRN